MRMGCNGREGELVIDQSELATIVPCPGCRAGPRKVSHGIREQTAMCLVRAMGAVALSADPFFDPALPT